MKLLKYILNIAVWTILGLYLLVILTFQIPATQSYLGRQAARMLSDKLGTGVDISRVELGIPNRLTLHDVLIRDQQDQEMLKARRLSARVSLLSLANGKIDIATAQLFGAQAAFYQTDSLSKPNFQFALDSLASKDTLDTAPLDLRINSLIVRQTSVTFDRLDLPETPGTLNPNHLAIADVSTHVILKTLSEDSLNVNIKRLAFKEKTGLKVDRLSLHLEAGPTASRLTDFLLRMPGTELKAGPIDAAYQFRDGRLALSTLRLKGSLQPSTLTPADLRSLLPSLKRATGPLALQTRFLLQGHDLEVPQLQVTSKTDNLDIDASGRINNIGQASPAWNVDLTRLRISEKAVELVSDILADRQVALPDLVYRLGDISMEGQAKGIGTSEIASSCKVVTDAGRADLDMTLDAQHLFNGNMTATDLDLGRLLDNPMYGLLDARLDVNGLLPATGQPSLKAEGTVSKFDYNGYPFQDISLQGTYDAQDIRAAVSIDDPNISLTMEGATEEVAAARHIKVNAVLKHLSPYAIHLTDRWGHATFGAELSADITAADLADATGTVDVRNLTMDDADSHYRLDRLHVTSTRDDGQRRIALDSDFGTLLMQGHFRPESLPQSITNLLAAKLPTMPGLPPTTTATQNNLSVSATVTKSDWIEQLLGVPLHLAKPVTLHGSINDATRQLNLECSAPQLYYKDSRYDNARLSVTSPLGTLLYEVDVTKLMDDGTPMALQVTGSAYDNRMSASLNWDNHSADRLNGKLTAMAVFDTTFDGKQRADVNIASSHMNIKDTDWEILPSHIVYYDRHLDINHFSVRHDGQFLTLSGTASEHAADAITFSMQDMDVEYLLKLVNFHAVDFSGLATGQGAVSGLFGNMEAQAALEVKDFKFEHGRMGTLSAKASWNPNLKRIDIHGICDDGADAMTYINGFVDPSSPGEIDLDIQARGTHLDFAHSFTESFLSHIDGYASGGVRLAGPLDAINLTGQLVLNGRAHVKTLGCTYELRNDTLRLIPNEIIFDQCRIYDIHDQQGILTGGIHHKELTHLTYDIFVDANNLMVYDFPDFGDDTFYGTVFAQGNAAIHGRPNEVTIEADITPLRNSTFVYNAATPDIITSQEFIAWNTGSTADNKTTDNGLADHEGADHAVPAAVPTLDRSDISLRLKLNVTPDATIRLLMDDRTSDYITLHGSGDLQANFYNKGGFSMFGTYAVSNGTYEVTIQDIIKKNFTFKDGGTIVFAGDPYDAQLNLQAQNVVNGVSLSDLNVGRSFANTVRVNCLMNITGQPKAPLIDFDLEMPTVNTDEQQMIRSIINGQEEMRQQVVYLLAVGRFYPQGANNATESEQARQGSTSLAMQSLLSGTLSGQINSVLNSVIKSNNWNFGANISTGDEGWNNAEYEGIVNGRLLNNRLIINGQFGYRDNATTANPSFIGDFDILYLLYPSGNLALKVYNQTNDRYFTRSSLNTQGIGIIMKKDFNGWRELFRRKE